MGSQDRLERTLREIHILFSAGESVEGEPNKVVVDRKKFLTLLDDLNHAVFEVMEAYEDTRESRMRAELEFQQRGRQMLEEATQRADDVYAASVLYTADAVGELQKLMDQLNDSMNDMFHSFRLSLREQKDQLRRNELELEAELQDMEDVRLYQGLLDEIRLQQQKESDEEHLEWRERALARRQKEYHIYTPATAADVKINEAYFEKQGISAEDAKTGYVPAPDPPAAAKPEVVVNYNSEYFRRKAALEKESAKEEPEAKGEAGKQPDPAAGSSPDKDPCGEEKEERLERFLSTIEAEPGPEEGTADPEEGSGGAAGPGTSENGGRREIPGWKERMKVLLHEITPKDLDEK